MWFLHSVNFWRCFFLRPFNMNWGKKEDDQYEWGKKKRKTEENKRDKFDFFSFLANISTHLNSNNSTPPLQFFPLPPLLPLPRALDDKGRQEEEEDEEDDTFENEDGFGVKEGGVEGKLYE